MTITLRPEQEMLLQEAINSGLARNTDEALDQAFEMLRHSLPRTATDLESVDIVARRLANFGKRRGLSLGGMTIKELLSQSRP